MPSLGCLLCSQHAAKWPHHQGSESALKKATTLLTAIPKSISPRLFFLPSSLRLSLWLLWQPSPLLRPSVTKCWRWRRNSHPERETGSFQVAAMVWKQCCQVTFSLAHFSVVTLFPRASISLPFYLVQTLEVAGLMSLVVWYWCQVVSIVPVCCNQNDPLEPFSPSCSLCMWNSTAVPTVTQARHADISSNSLTCVTQTFCLLNCSQ